MNCVSCDICVCHLWFVCVFFPWGIPQLQSDWSLSCDHGLDYASKCENNTAVMVKNSSSATPDCQRPRNVSALCYNRFKYVSCEFDRFKCRYSSLRAA